ncbi:MAG: DnaJ domain-containing protein [Chitinophagaceae bacterium]
MAFKDYYKILGIPPAATPEEIKKSYRKLAFRYHPDKAVGDKRAEQMFREVKEAYEILSRPIQREGFDYDYKKFYKTGEIKERNNGTRTSNTNTSSSTNAPVNKAPGGGSSHAQNSLTASYYLSKAKSIHTRFSVRGAAFDQEKLYQELNLLLQKNNITQLLIWGEGTINQAIIDQILSTCDLLSYKYINAVCVRLARLAGTDNGTIRKIFSYRTNRKHKLNVQRIKVVSIIIFLIVLFLFFGS